MVPWPGSSSKPACTTLRARARLRASSWTPPGRSHCPITGVLVRSADSMSTSMINEEAGLEGPVPGAVDAKGQPVNGLGQVRMYGSIADCCKAAPSVLEFDSDGKLLRAWGGPADPG